MSDLRVYVPGVDEFDRDGYPLAWRTIKNDIREASGHRCVRCGHPYRNGEHGSGMWSPCDERCSHGGPVRMRHGYCWPWRHVDRIEVGRQLAYDRSHVCVNPADPREVLAPLEVQARYRILTVHHLTGEKADCRWWNLAALCQRCHLTIQGRVVMERTWPHDHSYWFRPHAAGYYAWRFLGEEISREEATARLDELLALEVRQLTLEGAA